VTVAKIKTCSEGSPQMEGRHLRVDIRDKCNTAEDELLNCHTGRAFLTSPLITIAHCISTAGHVYIISQVLFAYAGADAEYPERGLGLSIFK
jgi:hypothetical protein